MAFYEVVGRDKKSPVCLSADNLEDAVRQSKDLFAKGAHDMVFIRQYVRSRYGFERVRILRRFTLLRIEIVNVSRGRDDKR